MSETVIVAALKRGNLRRAVELILDTYQEEVYGYCASLVGSTHSGSVYQQVLAVAMEELPTFNGAVSIRAWLYGIARRIVIRFQTRSNCTSGELPSYPESVDAPPGLRFADVELETCLDQMDTAVREILQLTLWHGLLLSEVGHITCRDPAEVRRMAAQGLSNLSGDLHRSTNTPS